MDEKQLNWLKSKAGYLKISPIEKELNMPEGTLQKFIAGSRELPNHWQTKVAEWVKNFKK